MYISSNSFLWDDKAASSFSNSLSADLRKLSFHILSYTDSRNKYRFCTMVSDGPGLEGISHQAMEK